jgi:hypothetical protein
MLPVGMRYAVLFALNASGSPAATNTTAYEGLQIVGARAFDLTIPDSRKITHVGDDRPLAVDYLPPTEGVSAELRVARNDYDVYAALTGTTVITVGESKAIGISTSKQGFEPQVGLMLFQQALDDDGTRHWRSFILPKATVYPHPNGMNDNPSEHRFLVSPAVVEKHLWEKAFAAATEGYTDAQLLEFMTRYKPKIVAFVTATATTSLSLPASYPAADTAKVAIWVDGVAQTAWTVATDAISTGTAPGNNKRVVVFYETNG